MQYDNSYALLLYFQAFNVLTLVGENHDIRPILPMYNNFLRECVQTRSLHHVNQCLDLMERQLLGTNEVTYAQFLKVRKEKVLSVICSYLLSNIMITIMNTSLLLISFLVWISILFGDD